MFFGLMQLTFMLHYRIHGFLLTLSTDRKASQSLFFHLSSNDNTAFR